MLLQLRADQLLRAPRTAHEGRYPVLVTSGSMPRSRPLLVTNTDATLLACRSAGPV